MYFVWYIHGRALDVWEGKSAVQEETAKLQGEGLMGKPEAHPQMADAQPMVDHRHPAEKDD